MEVNFDFMAGFILGMFTCAGTISALVILACMIVAKRADKTIENQELTRLFMPEANSR